MPGNVSFMDFVQYFVYHKKVTKNVTRVASYAVKMHVNLVVLLRLLNANTIITMVKKEFRKLYLPGYNISIQN